MIGGLARVRTAGLLAGAAGTLAFLPGAWLDRRQFFESYLWAFLFWSGLGLGALAILLLHHLVGGAWGILIRRILEASMGTIPLWAVLFVPLIAGLPDLYPWCRPASPEIEPLLSAKRGYLNAPFFLVRAGVFFAVWLGLSALLVRLSRGPESERRTRFWSGPGLLAYGLTMTFASFDWAMSLEPLWYSSIYGLLFLAGQGLSALALAVVAVALLSGREPLSSRATPARLNDLGNLLLTFVMLWAYLSYSQFLVIWSGNLPEEIPWYLARGRGGWRWVAALLVLFHFAVPFVVLLWKRVKRNARALGGLAGGLLLMRLLDVFWTIVPAFHPEGVRVHGLDIAALIAMGGFWLAAFATRLGARPILPEPELLGAEVPARG